MNSQLYSILPEKSGAYLFKEKSGKIIYVGKAKNLKKRVASYFDRPVQNSKTTHLVSQISSVDHIIVNSEIEAFLLEANLIKKYKPFYNINLRDDKFYPYIVVSRGTIPYVVLTRKKNEPHATYYGPYPDVASTRAVLKLIRRIFPFQSVKNHPRRKCLYYHLGLCPCIPVFPEHLAQYKRAIKRIEQFLEGKKEKVVKELEREQKKYVKREEFEQARQIQEKIDKINLITSPIYDPFSYEKDPDLYAKRIRNELESLKELLSKYFINLKLLDRIECYDISNISGTSATGSMVVFEHGEANKNHYRRFKIRSKQTPDDFRMIQEVLTRRLKHSDWAAPDLIIIDGGKGQLSAAFEVLHQHNHQTIPLIGLAKREETIVITDFDGRQLRFFEEKFPLSQPGLNLLRRIRDEAHRFAISYHRLLMRKRLYQKN